MDKTNFTVTYHLKQQTPMIHFQSDEEGATLRASEVKPKLDKFIIAQQAGGDYEKGLQFVREQDKERARKKKPRWLLGEHPALNYKLRFAAPNVSETPKIVLGKLFFANQSLPFSEKKRSVFYENEIALVVICFYKDIISEIDSIILKFFALTNFGLRQTKGYGSYLVRRDDEEYPDKKAFETLLPTAKTWRIDLGTSTTRELKNKTDIFDRWCMDASWIYSLLKAGINRPYHRSYLFWYMHSLKVGNEKAYIKSKYAWAAQSGSRTPKTFHSNGTHVPKYVRALLGASEFFEFDTDPPRHKKENLRKVFVCGKEIERIPSPILYRFFENALYLIEQDVPEKAFGHEFQFSDKKNKFGSDPEHNVISTPSDTEFNLHTLLEEFSKYFNGDSSHKANCLVFPLSNTEKQEVRARYLAEHDVEKLKIRQGRPPFSGNQKTEQQKLRDAKNTEYKRFPPLKIEPLKVGGEPK
jgi:hypothetical protein